MSDLDNAEFYWEIGRLDVDAVVRRGIETLFSPTAFDELEMGGSAENPILLDGQEDKEDSPPTTPISERPTRDVVHLEPEQKMFLIMFIEYCFIMYYRVCVLI